MPFLFAFFFRRKHSKRRAVDNSDNSDEEESTKAKRIKWTDEELDALEDGMRQFGKQWSAIKKSYGEKGQVLENRSAGQLKDKARSELGRRKRENIDHGVFAIIGL